MTILVLIDFLMLPKSCSAGCSIFWIATKMNVDQMYTFVLIHSLPLMIVLLSVTSVS